MNSMNEIRLTGHLNRKDAKRLDFILKKISRPVRISVKKRVAWRLHKKWFNRYVKCQYIESVITFANKTEEESAKFIVTSVKIEKAGRHKRDFIMNCKPIFEQ